MANYDGILPPSRRCDETRAHYAHEWYTPLRTYCPGGPNENPTIDVAALVRQREWSTKTFGPGRRTGGLISHIKKELDEIEADPTDVTEWIDVVILGLDGAWRAEAQPQVIVNTYLEKMERNFQREWPDFRLFSEDHPIEHVRNESNGE